MTAAAAAFRALLLAAGLAALAAAQEPSGLSIEHDQAEIVLGAAGDVRLSRAEAGVLHLDGDLLLGEVRLLEVIGALQAKVLALEARATAMGKFSSEAAVTDAINEAAQGVTDGLEEVVRLGRVNETIARAASDATAAKGVTDNLEEVVLTHMVGETIASAAADATAAKGVTDNLEEVVLTHMVGETIASAAADATAAKGVTDNLEEVVLTHMVNETIASAAADATAAKSVTDNLEEVVLTRMVNATFASAANNTKNDITAAVAPLSADGVVIEVCGDGSCDFSTVGAAVQHAADTYSAGTVRVRVHPLDGGAHYNESTGIGALGLDNPNAPAGLHVVVECTNVGTPGACTLLAGPGNPVPESGYLSAVEVSRFNSIELRRLTILPQLGVEIIVQATHGARATLTDVVGGSGFNTAVLATKDSSAWVTGCSFEDLLSHGLKSIHNSFTLVEDSDVRADAGGSGNAIEAQSGGALLLTGAVRFFDFTSDVNTVVNGIASSIGHDIEGIGGTLACSRLGLVDIVSDGTPRSCSNT